MQKKRIVLIFLGGAILLIVIAASLIRILNQASMVQANTPKPTPTQGSSYSYPDPTNQDALPDSVKVTGNDEKVLLRAVVTQGSQIYECQASKSDPSGFAWTFQAPFAIAEADDGSNVIHSTGPTWLYTLDQSQIKAKVGQFTRPDGTVVPANATPDANAIPWLRLDVTDHLGNSGLFSRVNQVQRLYTTGGKAPSTGCDLKTANAHVIREESYKAEYVFWGI